MRVSTNPRLTVTVAAVLLMGLALGLSMLFALLTFDRTFRDELLSRYYLPTLHLHANLQRAARHGVDLARASGIDRDVDRTWEIIIREVGAMDGFGAGVHQPSLLLVSPTGRVLRERGARPDLEDGAFREALSLPNAKGQSAAGTRYVESARSMYIPLRITLEDGTWLASVITVIDGNALGKRMLGPRGEATWHAAVAMSVALLVYLVLVCAWLRRGLVMDAGRLRRLSRVSVAFGLVAQIGSALSGALPYYAPYREVASEKARVVAELAYQDTTAALSRGMQLDYLDFRYYAWPLLRGVAPEVGSVEVRGADRALVVRLDDQGLTHYRNEKLRPAELPGVRGPNADDLEVQAVPMGHDGAQGVVLARLSDRALEARMLDLAADALAATMVALLVFVELLLLLHWALSRNDPAAGRETPGATPLIRPAAFMFLFGIDLSMSFVPLHMERLYEPLLGLSKDVMMGLPVSVEFLFVGIAILGAGVWVDRSGWRAPFVAGTAIAGMGAIYSWAAPDAVHFIVSRGVLGVGYGLTLMASQAYVIHTTDSRRTAQGLAHLFAGIYGGSICGGVAGAIVAERIGFGPVFLAGGVIILGVLAYALVVLPREQAATARAPAGRTVQVVPASVQGARLRSFMTNRSMLGLILFSSLPASIAAVGFLNYFSPVYLSRMGASQSTIGQVLMLYGVCLVFFGPWVSRSMDTVARKKQAVLAGCLLGGVAFLVFQLVDGLLAAMIAVVALGLSHSLVLSSQSAYALALKVSRELGEGKAISIFRSTGRIGQMLGPLAFGGIAVAGDVRQGVAIIGYAYLGAAVLFWLVTQRDRAMLVEGEA